MTYVEFHPSRVQIVITNLESLAESLLKIRRDIYDASDQNGHPVPSVDDTIDLGASVSTDSSNPKTLAGAVGSLTTIADELATRKREIIQLNSDGVITPNDDGTLSYYLPDKDDGTPVEDTLENFRAYNGQAAADGRADADSFRKALEDSNYNYDDPEVAVILFRMIGNQDIPAYGAAFIDQYGLADYLDLTTAYSQRNVNDHFRHALTTLSHVFAAATQADGGRNGATLSGEFIDLTEGKNGGALQTKALRMGALNELLSTPDTIYGTDFLTSLADHFEDKDPIVIPTGRQTKSQADPMEGILTAMGNNPDAALAYLSPDGELDDSGKWAPGDKSKTRWELLTSEDWRSKHDHTTEPLSAAIASASAYRGNTDSDGSKKSKPESAGSRASWVVGKAVPYFADTVPESDFTDTLKENLSVVMANCPAEIAGMANGDNFTDSKSSDLSGDVTNENFETLLYRIIDNKNAATTISCGVGEYYHDKFNDDIGTASDPAKIVKSQYQERGATSGYLYGIAQKRAGDDAGAQAEAEANMGTALTVLSTVADVGVTAVTGGTSMAVTGPLLFKTGSAIVKPIVADTLTGNAGGDAAINGSDLQSQLRATGYRDAADHGLLNASTLESLKDEKFYSETDGKPRIKLPDPITPLAASEVVGWAERDAKGDDMITDIDDSVSDGWTLGKTQGEEAEVSK